jgi:enamine deaminase RidA (YjgF/YER057c/UK114 family)
MRKNISTHSPSEQKVGYSRAVSINNRLHISGTVSINENGQVVGTTLKEQATFIMEKIKKVIIQEGFTLDHTVTVTAYITSMQFLGEFDEVFRDYFFEIKPTCTLVGINELVQPELLIEIECLLEKPG